jgi:hypothetical protein
MFSYLRKIINASQDDEWIQKQTALDEKIRNHIGRCDDTLIHYLLYTRAHGREQRTRLQNLDSLTDYIPTMQGIKKDNNLILEELSSAFDGTMDPCLRMREITKK